MPGGYPKFVNRRRLSLRVMNVLVRMALVPILKTAMRSDLLRRASLGLLDRMPRLKIKVRGVYFSMLTTQAAPRIKTRPVLHMRPADLPEICALNIVTACDDTVSSPLEKYSRSIYSVRQ